MDQFASLALERIHHLFGGMADCQHPDSSRQIDELIAIDISHQAPVGRSDRDRSELGVARGNGPISPSQNVSTERTGDFGNEADTGGRGCHRFILAGKPGVRP
jgi:hypothetical protein